MRRDLRYIGEVIDTLAQQDRDRGQCLSDLDESVGVD